MSSTTRIKFSALLDPTPSSTMPQSCFACEAVASEGVPLFCCGKCRSTLYCSKVCQRNDWKQHKTICTLLNVGWGGMQLRDPAHLQRCIELKEEYKATERCLHDDMKRFFKLFTASTLERSQAAARKMKKIVAGQIKHNQKVLLFHSLYLLIHTDSEKLLWPNSPLLVLLQFVDPNVLVLLQFVDPNVMSGLDGEALQEGENKTTLLHQLTRLTDPSDYSTHENQLTLGRQLIEHGANVNAVTFPNSDTPLHSACSAETTTNLDFIQLLLENGADPNAQDHEGMTPLMRTLTLAPGAAKFLLERPATDINITARSRNSFPAWVRGTVEYFSGQVALPGNPTRVEDQFMLQQWREIEEMLVERGATGSGITGPE